MNIEVAQRGAQLPAEPVGQPGPGFSTSSLPQPTDPSGAQREPLPVQRPKWATKLSGLWADPRVPFAGWHCVDVTDAAGRDVCEMCRVDKGRRITRA
jgi:hypothetical protein